MSMKPKSRLGRGLSSLISVSDDSAEAPVPPVVARTVPTPSPAIVPTTPVKPTTTPKVDAAPSPDIEPVVVGKSGVSEIPLQKIVPNPHQPRRQMNEASIAELAASLKTTGLIQPIVVRKVGDHYELIAGERRWRAAKVAGLTEIPAIIRNASSIEQAQMALVENIQRENLNPIDRALAYRTLLTQLGLTQSELANRTGEDRSSVANYLRLLDLGPAVQEMVVDGSLSMGHAKILAGIADRDEQERLANLVVNQSLSVRNLERQLQSPTPALTRTEATPSAHLQALEKSLTQQLGLRVQVKSTARKGHGKLILHYGTLDQFDDLVGRLGAKVES